MNILITGMNKLQCTKDFYSSQQLKVVPSHYSLIRCLEDMGHTVTQRPVVIGETLSEFDEVIVYIHNPAGFAAFVYNALWAISVKPDCILAFDDWQVDSIYSGITALEDTTKLFRPYIKDSQTLIPDDVEKYADVFLSSIEKIKSKTNRMMISAFAGGDLTKLLEYPKERMFSFNPNPYHLNRKPTKTPYPKQLAFNFAGLVQGKTKKWLKNLHIEKTPWPLMQYGSRKDGQDRVTEDVMVDIYGQQWGILLPGYFHAGSGWWRARYLQVADVGSILIGDPNELIINYGNQEAASVKPVDIVDMTEKQRIDFAMFQRNCLYTAHPLDKTVQIQELNTILNYGK